MKFASLQKQISFLSQAHLSIIIAELFPWIYFLHDDTFKYIHFHICVVCLPISFMKTFCLASRLMSTMLLSHFFLINFSDRSRMQAVSLNHQ